MPLTPTLVATPSDPPTYNVGMAETFSWVPIQGAGRPLFARATYLANASDISISLNAGNINLNTTNLENISNATNTKIDALTGYTDNVESLLTDLSATNRYVPGFSIPPYDEIRFEYVTTTDIFRKVMYFKNSTQVMALSFVYVTEPPTTGNAIIQAVKKM